MNESLINSNYLFHQRKLNDMKLSNISNNIQNSETNKMIIGKTERLLQRKKIHLKKNDWNDEAVELTKDWYQQEFK